jgi:hypothetical protein
MTTPNKNAFDAEAALKEILAEYWDYEQKINTHHAVVKVVKDLFYLKETGLRYGDWNREVKKFGSVAAWENHYAKTHS